MKVTRRIAVGGVIAVAIGALAALPVSAQVAPPAGPKTIKVKVGDNYFKPKKLKATVGDTVRWVWIGTAIHDVKSKGAMKFTSKKQASGKYVKVLANPGLYNIVCTLHPGMDMKITANAPPPPPPNTLAAP